jgi:mevalonate kinase
MISYTNNHSQPAIAAAVSLRTYLLITSTQTDEIILEFPDIGLTQKWSLEELPWGVAEKYHTDRPQPTDELVPEIVSGLAGALCTIENSVHYAAAYSFLYLYVCMMKNSPHGYRFTVRSTLPIGCGLGSSASISVCLAGALALLGNHVRPAALTASDHSEDNEDSLFIDSWAFMGEKCIQGNPSGVDNAVATHGGAVMFQRMHSSIPSVRTTMRNFPPLKLLLTNTRVPRSSAKMVGNVARLNQNFPKTTSSILDAIDALTREGYNIMVRPFLDVSAKNRLNELIEINHGLLVALGVSHPSLERVRMLTDELNIGKTKLTGAGGGGCAITLVNDDADEHAIRELIKKYESLGFETYETILGGKGVGYLPVTQEFPYTAEDFIQFSDRHVIESAMAREGLEWRFW